MKYGVLLINLGTPLSYKRRDVFRYLNEFLTDPRVIDLPFLKRQLLVRGLITPFRHVSSAKAYKAIWTQQGSPLLFHTQNLKKALQESLGRDYVVEIGMRYQEPSIEEALKSFQNHHLDKILIVPLFPQYASATTGSIYEKAFKILSKWNYHPEIKFLSSFYDHPSFIESFAAISQNYPLSEYDHILISFHGLPISQLEKTNSSCQKCTGCCNTLSKRNKNCYSAQCYKTAKSLIESLNLPQDRFSVAFQSRLGKSPWLTPFTSDRLKMLAQKGDKKVLVICPSFVCDCLETLYEIGIEYQELFHQFGGEKLTLMEGLNTHPTWVKALKTLICDTM